MVFWGINEECYKGAKKEIWLKIQIHDLSCEYMNSL